MLEIPIELLKCFSVHSVECVSKISSVLSIIFHAFYGAISIQQTDLSYNDCDNTFILSYYHHEISILTHLSLFRVRSWNNGMSCVFFLYSYRLNSRTARRLMNSAQTILPASRSYPESKVYGANMGPTCGRQDPGEPHVSPMNFAVWVGDRMSCRLAIRQVVWNGLNIQLRFGRMLMIMTTIQTNVHEWW